MKKTAKLIPKLQPSTQCDHDANEYFLKTLFISYKNKLNFKEYFVVFSYETFSNSFEYESCPKMIQPIIEVARLSENKYCARYVCRVCPETNIMQENLPCLLQAV